MNRNKIYIPYEAEQNGKEFCDTTLPLLTSEEKSKNEEFILNYSENSEQHDIYKNNNDIIDSQNEDFVLNRINLNKINALMSQFTFTVFPNSKEAEVLRSYGKEENGYLFLESFSEIYSFENGIDTSKFYTSNFL